MEYFVPQGSIVRQIWGKGDTILFIFAGAAAEFALNKAVDWLYFTGRLPADPLGRLFSTVSYARQIVFSPAHEAEAAIDKITAIHKGVEAARGAVIPDWAYRDVLFMLIHYSIAAYELLERAMTAGEKQELYHVFYRMGTRMHLQGLPEYYVDWLPIRDKHLEEDLAKSDYSTHLFMQYKKHLGLFRYKILWEGQKLVVPARVKKLLDMNSISLAAPLLGVYKVSRRAKLDWFLKSMILPSKYKSQIKDLDIHPTT